MPDETEDGPVLETLGAMTAASLERCELAPDALLLVRIARPWPRVGPSPGDRAAVPAQNGSRRDKPVYL